MVNYARELEQLLERPEIRGKRLLLHSCCAPCSSYVLEYLREFFRITVFYFNPNITRAEEYEKRKEEQKRLIGIYNRQVRERDVDGMNSTAGAWEIGMADAAYEPELFLRVASGLEDCPEGGERCLRCYELRLEETAREAARQGFDFFCTTLSISPLKNAERINEAGFRAGEKYGVLFLPSDFKKRDGFKRSVELSSRFGLYRQDYCGCAYSQAQRERERQERAGRPEAGRTRDFTGKIRADSD